MTARVAADGRSGFCVIVGRSSRLRSLTVWGSRATPGFAIGLQPVNPISIQGVTDLRSVPIYGTKFNVLQKKWPRAKKILRRQRHEAHTRHIGPNMAQTNTGREFGAVILLDC